MKIFNFIVLAYLILICLLGMFYKHISFGWGLGDIFGYILLIGGTILHGILSFLMLRRKGLYHGILAIVSLIFALFISLQATIWRGGEYPWNGSIFYLPCPKEITITNDSFQKELLVRMCTGEYQSQFSGNWNGKEIEITNGSIEIPDELREYIEFPIDKVLIQPHSNHLIRNNELVDTFHFSLNNLKLENEYDLTGRIIKIKDKRPVIEVRM